MAAGLKVATIGSGGWTEGYVVRGTIDPLAAKRAVQRYRLEAEQEPAREAVRVPPVHRVGLFRWNPCNCYGREHFGHIASADQPGRGVWPGVYFDGGI